MENRTEKNTEKKSLEGQVRLEITGGQGEITTAVSARCYYKNKSYYLLFQEGIGEDGRENAVVFSSRLKISEDQVTLRRSTPGEDGQSSRPVMEMVYRVTPPDSPGHFMDYPTPYGKLHLEIRTDELTVRETEEEVTVTVQYRLMQENQEASRDRLTIRIHR